MRLMDMEVSPCASLCSHTGTAAVLPGAAPVVQQPSAPLPGVSSQHLAFLQGWQTSISPKLQQLLTLLAGEEVARNLAVAQIWTYLPVLTEGRQLLKAEQLCLLGDSALQQFHAGCCQEGVAVSQLGPMGKVWESGAVQVVQCAESLSSEAHPCNRLPGGLASRIAECIYVPIYDRTGQVSQGVLAVVELLIRSQSHDHMVVANAISTLTHLLDALQLSLSNPHQQQQPSASTASAAAAPAAAAAGTQDVSGQPPAKRAALGSSTASAPGAATSAAMAMPQTSSYVRNNAAGFGSGGSSGGGSGGALGRSISMRTFS